MAFETAATEVLYGGAAGGGKSHLMRIAALVWCCAIPGLQVYLFRRVRDDLIKNHMEGPKGFRAVLAAWVMQGWVRIVDDEIRFWNGSKIYLCHCHDERDIYKYQGAEIHVLLIDELTHFTEAMYRFLRNRVRMVGLDIPAEYAGRFPRIMCGANPGNIGHLFVKDTFVTRATALRIDRMPAAEGGMLRQYIPARLDDNPSMLEDDPGYEARLEGLGSKTLVAAMRWGDWDVVEGAFFDCWSNHKHVVAPFAVPEDWMRFRSADWGSASPFSIGWWAVAQDDYSVSAINVSRTLPRGALIRYREWYGASSPGRGLKLTAEAVADGIIERERTDPRLAYGVLDPSAFKEDGGPSIAERINTRLVAKRLPGFREADNARVTKARGSDKAGAMGGWDQLRARMIGNGQTPMIFCFSTCLDSIRTIPILQHDPHVAEDLDTHSEDHCFAAGTLVETDRGPVPIERLPATGWVLSADGYRLYRSARMTRRNTRIVRVTFEDGRSVLCTPDHRFVVDIDDWRYASDLVGASVICAQSSSATRSRSLMESDITFAGATFRAKVSGSTAQQREADGIPSTSPSTSSRQWIGECLRYVRNAARITWSALRGSRKASSADQTVERVRCVSVEEAGRADVYCLTVPSTGCFAIEGGILVSNCADDWRYGAMSRPWLRTIPKPDVPKDGYRPASEEIPTDSILTM